VPRGRYNSSLAFVVFPLVCLFLVGLGLHAIWHSTVTLPRTYDRLAASGVPATAILEQCAPGLGGGHGVACRLTLDTRGSTRTWVYPENSRQFEDLPTDAAIPMLVDPRHAGNAYTVTDVRARTNAGFGFVAGFGVFFVGLGAAGLGLFGWLARLGRRRRRFNPDPAEF